MRASAREVLERYARGERDFRGANLRGQSFENADLSGADFANADIRSTNFEGATLRGTNFSNAAAGLQRRWMFLLLFGALLLSAVGGFLGPLPGAIVGTLFEGSGDLSGGISRDQIAGVIGLAIAIVTVGLVWRKGIVIGATAGAIVGAVTIAGVVAIAGSGAFAGAFAGAVAVARAFAVAGAVAGVVAISGAIAFAVAGAGAFAVTVARAFAVAFTAAGAFVGAGTFAVAVAVAVAIVGAAIGWRALARADERDLWVRHLVLAYGSFQGTNFQRADLTDANFTAATLKSTNFYRSTLTRTRWQDARKLYLARGGPSLLSSRAVRALLVTGNGYKQDYTCADLEGANLSGANLEAATLKGANLTNATLEDATLKDANLSNAQCAGTDFTRAYLTGACLEAWQIDAGTVLNDVDCQFVFLLEQRDRHGNRYRRPYDPDRVFQSGDFEKLYTEVVDTLQILLRDGINPDAFRAAFIRLTAEHPELTPDSIQSVEKKGTDALITLAVTSDTDKAKVEQDFTAAYKASFPTAADRAPCDSQETDMQESRKLFATSDSPIVELIQRAANSTECRATDRGGDGSGPPRDDNDTLSGAIARSIQHRPSNTARQADLKTALARLHHAIATDPALDDRDRAYALTNLQAIIQRPTEADTAFSKLQRLAQLVPEATRFAIELRRAIPAIAALSRA